MRSLDRPRLATVVVAPAAALAAWAAARVAGVDFVLKDGSTVGPGEVFTAAVAGAVAGWLVVRWLERRSRRPRSTWAFLGSTALAVSIVGPSRLADGSTAVALIGLHFVTAAVVIVGFARTLPIRRGGIHGARQRPASDPAR
jgi:hypothetical protein